MSAGRRLKLFLSLFLAALAMVFMVIGISLIT